MSGTNEFIPFARPDIGDAEIAEVVDSLRSGWVSSGPKVVRFEKAFQEFLAATPALDSIGPENDKTFTVAVSSGTAALHLALIAVGIGQGDEVITSAYTFTGCAEAIQLCGARPIFVDVEPATLNLRVDAVQEAISERTRAIMPVHFAGLACEMPSLLALAEKFDLRIVEDAAHALPTTSSRRLVGALDSDATAFSFYATKTLTTGEGGMITCRDRTVFETCLAARFHGIRRDLSDRYRSEHPAWDYDVEKLGFKYNMTDIQTSLGIHQLARAHTLRERRETMAKRYDEALVDLPLRLPEHAAAGDLHAWHLYVIRLEQEARVGRDEFINEMASRGVGCSVHFKPLPLHTHWSQSTTSCHTPVAIAEWERAVSLPLYTAMNGSDQERVINAVRKVLR